MNACAKLILALECSGDIEDSSADVSQIRNPVTLRSEPGFSLYPSIALEAGRPGAGPDVSHKTLTLAIIFQQLHNGIGQNLATEHNVLFAAVLGKIVADAADAGNE
jgi:hypothetical protein